MNKDLTPPISDDKFDSILQQLSTSDLSVTKICKSMHISKQSFYDYMECTRQDSKDRYARAKEDQQKYIAEELIPNIIEKAKDEVQNCDPKCANALASVFREEIKHHQWKAERLSPKVFGQKVDLTDGSMKIIMVNQNVANSQQT